MGTTKVKKSSENDQSKKALKNDLLTGHFQLFCFFNISRTVSKISKVNQQSVLNLKIFHHFPENLDRTITLTVSLSKLHCEKEPKNILFFQETNNIKS